MRNLAIYDGSFWLYADEGRLRHDAMRAAGVDCFTLPQVRRAHRKAVKASRMGEVFANLSDAVHFARSPGGTACACEAMGTGEIDPGESQLAGDKAIRPIKNRIGIIGIHGPIEQRTSSAIMKMGGTSTDFISAALNNLLADNAIGAIVLHIDSPGGSSFGIEETAAKIRDVAGKKPCYAIWDSICASGALWLGSAASQMFSTPGGLGGSVGVFRMHVDESKALENEGIKITTVSAGKYKTELHPTGPISEDALASMQSQVDAIYDKFVSGLAEYRNTSKATVRESYGQGRTMSADDALRVGLLDRIMTFENLLSKLAGMPTGVKGPSMASAEMAMMQMRRDRERKKKAS